MKIKRPEVLSPCGTEESFEAALASGADAVYLAGNAFGARAYAGNFEFQGLPRIIRRAHFHGVKVYLTLNTLIRDQEFRGMEDILRPLDEAGLDACLVQDPGLFVWLKEHFPRLPLHASTQMNITGPAGARLLRDMGAARIVAAREMSLEEIRAMKEASGLEVEVFVHGAMCVSYSGRCLLSSAAGERSGNRGRCAQPCRKMYGGAYPLSMKDLSALPYIPALIEAGVDSLKIEGRMKQPAYTAAVTEVYREAVDAAIDGSFSDSRVARWEERLSDAFSRGDFGRGYLFGGRELLTGTTSGRTGVTAGRITGTGSGRIRLRAERHILPGDELHPEGHPEIRLTSDRDIPAGMTGELASAGTAGLKKGTGMIRTRSAALEKHVEELREKGPVKVFHGVFRAKRGLPMELCLSAEGKDGTVTAVQKGDVPLPAEKRAAEEKDIREKLLATGGTEFSCEELLVEMDEDLFIPASLLKKMRREGLALLQKTVEDSWTRGEAADLTADAEAAKAADEVNAPETQLPSEAADAAMAFFFVVSTPEQAAFILQRGRTFFREERAQKEIGTEAGTEEQKKGGAEAVTDEKEFWLIPDGFPADGQLRRILEEAARAGWKTAVGLPYVTSLPVYPERDRLLQAAEQADGIYIRCLEDLSEVLTEIKEGKIPGGKTLLLASSLYAFNRRAVQFYRGLFPGMRTILEGNTELSGRELEELCRFGEVVPKCYGREALMITAALPPCPEGRVIRDEKNHEFFISSPQGMCYNVLLNGIPLSLHRERPESGFMHFTTETAGEIQKVLEAFSGRAEQAGYPYTRGHFSKGVL